MEWIAELNLGKFILFTLVLTRVSGICMVAPVYGSDEVPRQIRALFAASMAFLIMPSQWHVNVVYPGSIFNYLAFVGSELLIGLSLGLGVHILFTGIQLAGQVIGRVSGLMLADVIDPTSGASVSVFSRVYYLVAIAVFVCIGGHRLLIMGLLDTFEAIPPGTAEVQASLGETFTTILSQSFQFGFRAGAPVVTAVLISTVVLGLIARTMPQLNILAVGFGMNSMLSLGIMGFSIGTAVFVFQDQVEPTIRMVLRTLGGGG